MKKANASRADKVDDRDSLRHAITQHIKMLEKELKFMEQTLEIIDTPEEVKENEELT